MLQLSVYASLLMMAASLLPSSVVQALDGYGPLPTDEGLAVGDEICVYGFIMDEYCIKDVSVVTEWWR